MINMLRFLCSVLPLFVGVAVNIVQVQLICNNLHTTKVGTASLRKRLDSNIY